MDKSNFNKLTNAELERLALLAEEAAEVVHMVNKIIRHGYAANNPKTNGPINRDLLASELNDLLWVMNLMTKCGDIKPEQLMVANKEYKQQYLHYNMNVENN